MSRIEDPVDEAAVEGSMGLWGRRVAWFMEGGYANLGFERDLDDRIIDFDFE